MGCSIVAYSPGLDPRFSCIRPRAHVPRSHGVVLGWKLFNLGHLHASCARGKTLKPADCDCLVLQLQVLRPCRHISVHRNGRREVLTELRHCVTIGPHVLYCSTIGFFSNGGGSACYWLQSSYFLRKHEEHQKWQATSALVISSRLLPLLMPPRSREMSCRQTL